ALAYPERMETPAEKLDLGRIARLDFEVPDADRFPALRLARAALEAGGAQAIVLNAANEVAVAAFLAEHIGFLEIARLVEEAVTRSDASAPRSIAEVIDIDAATREKVSHMMRALPA
ncbi:MAG: 1-deoxy-D-xylulose-5-phosphate reductoisomerase, partial [Pseudomonadota bacterium]|nr:1-deoxy-D-xylulose-5-phosphate reductoisomerase [Pseudomonadota bacterium]